MWPRGWVEVWLYSSMTTSLEGGEWSAACPGRTFTPRKGPVPILQEAGWAPGPVWAGGKSHPHWDSIPDRPACSQSLYRLIYHLHTYIHTYILTYLLTHTHSLTYLLTHSPTHLITYLLIYLLHGGESFLRIERQQ